VALTPEMRPPQRPSPRPTARAKQRRQGRLRLALAVALLSIAGFAIAALASSGTPTRRTSTAAPVASPPLSTAPALTTATATHSAATSATPVAGTTATQTGTSSVTATATPPAPVVVVDHPARVRLIVVPALPDDGHWRRPERWSGWPAPVLTTTLRLGLADPSQVAYVAWFRAARSQVALYPGSKNPEQTPLPRGPEQVPVRARSRLLAVFNAGFYEHDAPAGFFVNGLLYHPMIRGLGTVVQYRSGRIDVVAWHGGDRPGSNVIMARQNLVLFVNHARANPALDVSERWGSTWQGAPAVWRSGLGIDAHGNLIYLAAPNQTAPSLADLLLRVGAVRAIQLDINPAWPVLVTYGSRDAQAASLFVQNPNQNAGRFLSPGIKDFFAVYLRGPAPVGNEPY
jgi:hypothetical protein